nr:MAG TPA: hypothetical protein [Bacteriophage sp.]
MKYGIGKLRATSVFFLYLIVRRYKLSISYNFYCT